MFQKLTDKQIVAVQKHREAHGTRSANVFRANLMRGKSLKEAKKIAEERTPNLPPRRSRRKAKEAEVKEPEANGDDPPTDSVPEEQKQNSQNTNSIWIKNSKKEASLETQNPDSFEEFCFQMTAPQERQEGEEERQEGQENGFTWPQRTNISSRLSVIQNDEEFEASFVWPRTLTEMIEEVESGTVRLNNWLLDGTIDMNEYVEHTRYNQLLIEICEKIQEAQGSDYLPPLSSDVWDNEE